MFKKQNNSSYLTKNIQSFLEKTNQVDAKPELAKIGYANDISRDC